MGELFNYTHCAVTSQQFGKFSCGGTKSKELCMKLLQDIICARDLITLLSLNMQDVLQHLMLGAKKYC
jgi:hypothetical protein